MSDGNGNAKGKRSEEYERFESLARKLIAVTKRDLNGAPKEPAKGRSKKS